MERLEIKQVSFLGTELIAACDDSGQIWVGIRKMCSGIGMDKNQSDNQVQKVQTEKILKQGVRRFPTGVFDANNETIGLKLEFVPIWLAKINITSKMEHKNPKLAQTLAQYRLSVKDALAAAFYSSDADPDNNAFPSELNLLINMKVRQKEQEQSIKKINQRIDDIRDVVALSPNSWRSDTQKLIARIAQTIGGDEYIKDVYDATFRLLNERAGVSLSTRLINKRRRMADEGVRKSVRDKLNNLDIIADDKKLIAIYIGIVKEMAVKYGVSLQTIA